MARTTETVANIVAIDRAGSSRNGNPTYRLTADDGRSWLTLTDGGVGYAATNYAPRSGHSTRLVLTVNGRGRVVAIDFAN